MSYWFGNAPRGTAEVQLSDAVRPAIIWLYEDSRLAGPLSATSVGRDRRLLRRHGRSPLWVSAHVRRRQERPRLGSGLGLGRVHLYARLDRGATPIPEAPYGVVAVRAPGSLHGPASGLVRIEHLSVTGHNDVIDRSVAEAVPLFWRFMIKKFGVDPHARQRPH